MLAPRAASTVAIDGDGQRPQGRPDQGHVQRPARAWRAVPVPGRARDLQAERPAGGGRGRAERALLVARGHQDAEGEAAADHDLLDVDDLDAGTVEGVEDGGGHPGPVRAGDRDEQRARCGFGHAQTLASHRRLGPRGGSVPVQDADSGCR